MQHAVTGQEIQHLRERLGMGVPQFAQLLGVHVATAYRWEAQGALKVALDPLHFALLVRLQQSIDTRPTPGERTQWGQELLKGVLIGGTLSGLAVLLAELLPSRTSHASAKALRKRKPSAMP
jgi:hypothetical protein